MQKVPRSCILHCAAVTLKHRITSSPRGTSAAIATLLDVVIKLIAIALATLFEDAEPRVWAGVSVEVEEPVVGTDEASDEGGVVVTVVVLLVAAVLRLLAVTADDAGAGDAGDVSEIVEEDDLEVSAEVSVDVSVDVTVEVSAEVV
eukprot:TRINITY_DN20756_c0_g1_i1.p2 TRINITY_DN20756_c0_g1~~TRINITY_DN20756_c0_g1_i1.p2  ORF type:complete len:146 (-),score=15.67 TRINITY_DN20756_c0_g1_i1:280-717(-)